jgi:hypothetical protein
MSSTVADFGYSHNPSPDFCERQPRHRFYTHSQGKIAYIRSNIEVAEEEQTLEEWFNERADSWARLTGFHSSPVIRFMHSDYQLIMARGKEVIPHILNRMKTKPDDWFWALKFLAGGHDAAENAAGFNGAIEAWLKWGIDEGYIYE